MAEFTDLTKEEAGMMNELGAGQYSNYSSESESEQQTIDAPFLLFKYFELIGDQWVPEFDYDAAPMQNPSSSEKGEAEGQPCKPKRKHKREASSEEVPLQGPGGLVDRLTRDLQNIVDEISMAEPIEDPNLTQDDLEEVWGDPVARVPIPEFLKEAELQHPVEMFKHPRSGDHWIVINKKSKNSRATKDHKTLVRLGMTEKRLRKI